MSNIHDIITNNIYDNDEQLITGNKLQRVLIAMVDRDVFLTQEEYNELVEQESVDPDKIYHIYEE